MVFGYRKSAIYEPLKFAIQISPVGHNTHLDGGVMGCAPSFFDDCCQYCRMGFGVGVSVHLLAMLSRTSMFLIGSYLASSSTCGLFIITASPQWEVDLYPP